VSRLLATTEPLSPPSAAVRPASSLSRDNTGDPVATPLAWASQADSSSRHRLRTALLVLLAVLAVGGGYFALRGSFRDHAPTADTNPIAAPAAVVQPPAMSDLPPTAASADLPPTAASLIHKPAGSGAEDAKSAAIAIGQPPTAASAGKPDSPPPPSAASDQAKSAAAKLPSPDATPLARPRLRAAPEPETARPSAKPVAAPPASGLSDFGGRR
jgi:hypothetical protein